MLAPQIDIARRPELRVGPRLVRAIGVLSKGNVELGIDLARSAAVNPFMSLSGGTEIQSVGSAAPSLYGHVVREIGLLGLSEEEQTLAFVFVEHLAPSGWLEVGVSEIALVASAPEATCTGVLEKLQRIEPAGLFARTLAECLALQARAEGVLTTELVQMLSVIDVLKHGGSEDLAAASGLPQSTLEELLTLVRGFDPKPGAQFQEMDLSLVRAPDVLAEMVEGEWSVRLNPAYRTEVALVDCPDHAPMRQRRLAERARTLRDAVERRHVLVERIANAMVRHQTDWLQETIPDPIPLTRAAVAEAIGVHETTVGRVVSSMAIQTPRGVLGMVQFFSRAFPGSGWSLARLEARIAAIIEGEGALCLSDQQISARLLEEGAVVSRRSVARHRQALGLPSRSVRKRKRAAGKKPPAANA